MIEYFEPQDTFNFGPSWDGLVLWRGQQRELRADLEIAAIQGKIDANKYLVNDIASGIIQIAINNLNDKSNGQTSLSLVYIFYHKTNASSLLIQGWEVSLSQSLKMFGCNIF